jgi:hypothetical protein
MLAHNPLVIGLEQGVLALLSSQSTRALLRFAPAPDLALFCCALVAAMRSAPRGVTVAGRLSHLVSRVLATIALNTVLQAVAIAPDAGTACVNLLSVHFLAQALDSDGTMASTAQYLLVDALSNALEASKALPVAWGLSFLGDGELSTLAQLVSVQTFSTWLQGWMPPSLLLAGCAILLYLCAPFTEEFPALGRLYRFAVFALSNDTALSRTPSWLIAAGLWALWQFEPDPVSKRLASVAGCNLAVLTVLDATQFAMGNDPAPTLIGLLIVIRILEEAMEKSEGPITGADGPRSTRPECSPQPGIPRTR